MDGFYRPAAVPRSTVTVLARSGVLRSESALQPSLGKVGGMEGADSPVARVDEIAGFGRPRMWVALIGLVALIAVFIVWGFVARTPVAVPVQGLITTTSGVSDIGSSLTGTVTSVYVAVGDRVDPGNNVVEIQDDAGRVVRVRASVPGQVLEVDTRVGDFVTEGQSLMIVQAVDQPVIAIALVPVNESGGLTIGQEVLVSPASAPSSEYGYIEGVVSFVGAVPVSPARLEQLTSGVAGAVDPDAQSGPVVEVEVALARADTPSGFDWTIGSGPSFTPLAGTPFSGQIVVGEQAPLMRLLG